MRMARGTPARDVLRARKRAMQPLKDVLRREGRSQAWLVRELRRRGFATSQQSFSNYLNGYGRITAAMLEAACIIACGNATMGDLLRDGILTAAGDAALLIQGMTVTETPQRRKTASA